jgi:hypothetical protein
LNARCGAVPASFHDLTKELEELFKKRSQLWTERDEAARAEREAAERKARTCDNRRTVAMKMYRAYHVEGITKKELREILPDANTAFIENAVGAPSVGAAGREAYKACKAMGL